jgi:hypothetical protein
MKPHVVLLAALSAKSLLALAQPSLQLDSAWHVNSESRQYEGGVADDGYARGGHAKYLRSDKAKDRDWGTLMQSFSAAQYRGKRLRFEAQVRTEGVTDWSGLWMRVDCEGQYSCSFYNSMDKPIKGTRDWQLRSVTLEVPQNAQSISFGVIAAGKGTVWIDELKMNAVGNNVPVDAMPARENGFKLRPGPSL